MRDGADVTSLKAAVVLRTTSTSVDETFRFSRSRDERVHASPAVGPGVLESYQNQDSQVRVSENLAGTNL